jgi:PAS domain S-box-containing protein
VRHPDDTHDAVGSGVFGQVNRKVAPVPGTLSTHARPPRDSTILRTTAYVGRLLRAEGWTVDAVPDGRAALARARRVRPDLVLSDVMMPGLDGFALLRALRADASTATIPVILLSARAGEEARVEGAQAGADDYLVKPFAAQELVARVGSHLSLARARAAATSAVAAARDLLTRVLEQAPVGICVMHGPEHVFELANAYYRRFLPPDRPVVGRSVREVVPEAEAQGFVALLDRVRETGEPWIGRGVEIVYDRHGNGVPESAFLNLLYHPLQDLDGTLVGVIAVVAEVTEEVRARHEAEEARREAMSARSAADEAREAAEAANKAKSEFLAVMSHELRTPLNAIGGYVELMELGIHGPLTDEQRGALARIARSQRHLLGLINDVLNLARIETGRVEYVIEPLPVGDVIAGLRPMIEPQLSAKDLAFTSHVPDAPCVIRGDRDKVAQILLNLLSNAVKFTPAGGRVAIEVQPERAGTVAIRVSDTGIGIPADKLEAIFEPFVQVRAGHTRDADGVGLGLAISRDLARGMGGDLAVESTVGEGSAFTLTLPIGQQQRPAPEALRDSLP